jgi:hypothetical protein
MKFASAFYGTRGDVEPWMIKAAESVAAAADLVGNFVRMPRVDQLAGASRIWFWYHRTRFYPDQRQAPTIGVRRSVLTKSVPPVECVGISSDEREP